MNRNYTYFRPYLGAPYECATDRSRYKPNQICATQNRKAKVIIHLHIDVLPAIWFFKMVMCSCVWYDSNWYSKSVLIQSSWKFIRKNPMKNERISDDKPKHLTFLAFTKYTLTRERADVLVRSNEVVYAYKNITAINLVKNWNYHVDLSDITKWACNW